MVSMAQVMTTARPTSAPSMTQMRDFVITCFVIVLLTLLSIACASGFVSVASGIFFVIVLARCAAIADGTFVCEDFADNVIESLVSLETLLRDFVAVSPHGKARELQLIGMIELILCAEVVFASMVSEVVFVCIHVRASQRFRFPCRCYRADLLRQ